MGAGTEKNLYFTRGIKSCLVAVERNRQEFFYPGILLRYDGSGIVSARKAMVSCRTLQASVIILNEELI